MNAFALLEWRPHLNPTLGGLLLLGGAAWLFVLDRRLARRFSRTRARWLLAPKLLVLLWLLLALFNPVTAMEKAQEAHGRILAALDHSSSMDVKDAGGRSRWQRAQEIVRQWRAALPAGMALDALAFDTGLRSLESPAAKSGVRGTDLAQVLAELAARSDVGACQQIILLSDGGDEPADPAVLPSAPLSIVGIGSNPAAWNDVSIRNVQFPATVEKGIQFSITVDAAGSAGAGGGFAARLSSVPLKLAQFSNGAWRAIAQKTVDLSHGRARAEFSARCSALGAQHYRVWLDEIPGELSALNNSRTFTVVVQKKSLRVLYYAGALGQSFKLLRRELARDPGISFSALIRAAPNRFEWQGERPAEADDLGDHFPDRKQTLEHYDVLILEIAGAEEWSPKQMQAVADFAAEGGAVVFMGEDGAYGGAYGSTPWAALFPWRPSEAAGALMTGIFPVQIPPLAAGHPILSGVDQTLLQTGAAVESLNPIGELKPAAVALLITRMGARDDPLVALQNFGRGKALAVASNTLWRWGMKPEPLRSAYGLFWRQTIRFLAGKMEGGRNLSVRWDKAFYRPGEQAVGRVRWMAPGAAEALRWAASLTISNQTAAVPAQPAPESTNELTVTLPFHARGEHQFRLELFQGNRLLDHYEKTFVVSPALPEGSRLEVDSVFLQQLAERGGGSYAPETEALAWFKKIAPGAVRQRIVTETSLMEGKAWLLWLLLAVLVAEWTLRRRMGLFLLACGLCCFSSRAQEEARAGSVQFSNGDVWRGTIELAPGAELKVHTASGVQAIAFDQVRSIRFEPEQEEFAQRWHFIQPGSPAKERIGAPYPLRKLRAAITLANEQTIAGHLYTAVLRVKTDAGVRKLILLSKQRGREGQSLAQLAYPREIDLGSAAAAERTIRVAPTRPGLEAPTRLIGLTYGELIRFEARRAASGAPEFILPAEAPRCFLAARNPQMIWVGWPPKSDPSLRKQIEAGLAEAEDFFDQRQLLGAFQDPSTGGVYSLMMLRRAGPTTLAKKSSQPWRLAVLRWKLGDHGRLLLAGRGYFFRGILPKNGAPPPVEFSDDLWKSSDARK